MKNGLRYVGRPPKLKILECFFFFFKRLFAGLDCGAKGPSLLAASGAVLLGRLSLASSSDAIPAVVGRKRGLAMLPSVFPGPLTMQSVVAVSLACTRHQTHLVNIGD